MRETKEKVGRVDSKEAAAGALGDGTILGISALAVRLAWVAWGRWVAGDTWEYLRLAKNLRFHHIFSMGETAASLAPTAFRPPLYPALIAILWWGENPPLISVMILQAVCGAATVVLVYLMARDYFNRPVALIAGLGMVFAPLSCRYTSVIMTETLFTFLITLGFFLWGREHFVRAGVVFGLSALTRPTMPPFLLALPLLALIVPAWRPYWRKYAIIFVMVATVSSVWIARNALVFGRFIPIAASGWGTNLLFGTIETKFTGDDVWTAVLNDPATRVDPGLNEVEADRAKMRKALGRIAADPRHWLYVRAKQYPRLFMDSGDYLLGSYNLTIGQAIREPRPLVILTKFAFILGNLALVLLAAYGMFAERARFVALSHITLFPIFLAASHLPMWIGDSRYSLPMVPLVAILAAVGLLRVAEVVGFALKRRAMFAPKDHDVGPGAGRATPVQPT
ncbi:MAG TPA: glycosyltransferase family 39 protein [Pyrinomonadaceae bacterium]|jgi:4-amino-4-deoxy-L-arabinose transferase-like glycosyltransferase|nr:glycosyltransferase family 39 protein [Pyrinomonadaceae bacterium]